MRVSLTKPEIKEFVLSQVGHGRFASADEAVESLLSQLMRVVCALNGQGNGHSPALPPAKTAAVHASAPMEGQIMSATAAVSSGMVPRVTYGNATPELSSDLMQMELTEADTGVSFSAALLAAEEHRREVERAAAQAQRDDDDILINGTPEDLRAFTGKLDKCILLSQDTDETSLITAITSRVGGDPVQHEWSSEYDKLTLAWRSRRAVLALTLVPMQDCDTIIRGFNALLSGDYEIRVFRHTLGEDVNALYLQPAQWWGEIEACFPQRIAQVFSAITPEVVLV